MKTQQFALICAYSILWNVYINCQVPISGIKISRCRIYRHGCSTKFTVQLFWSQQNVAAENVKTFKDPVFGNILDENIIST